MEASRLPDEQRDAAVAVRAVVDALMAYPWPGNVRELQNCIERAVILTEGDTIHARHLSLSFRDSPTTQPSADASWSQIDLSDTLAEASRHVMLEAERRKIEQTLKETGGNRGRTAELLQINFKVLLAKLREYGLES